MRAICSSGSNSTWRRVSARIRWCPQSTTTTVPLSSIARTAYANNRADAIHFLEFYAWRAHLPSEIPALALAIQRFREGPNEAAYLESLLRLILEGSSRDAAGFSSAALDIVSRITDLQIRRHGDRRNRIYRDGRAADLSGRAAQGAALRRQRVGDTDAVDLQCRAKACASGRQEISPIDFTRTTHDTRARAHRPVRAVRRCRAPANAMAQLRGPDAAPLPLRVRPNCRVAQSGRTAAHRGRTVERMSEAAERDYFYEKSALFTMDARVDAAEPCAQQGAARVRRIPAPYRSDVSRRTLWFAFVNRLLELARGSSRTEILSAMEQSHQPVTLDVRQARTNRTRAQTVGSPPRISCS